MLEWASTCLETGGRQLLRPRKPCLRTRRMLHSTFWHHGASDLALPFWWPTASVFGRTIGDVDDSRHSNSSIKTTEGPCLEFLYPAKTLALLRKLSKYKTNTLAARRRHQLSGTTVRQFSTTRWKAKRVNTELLDPQVLALQGELEGRLQRSNAHEALRDLLASGEQQKQELAWRLYLAIPERGYTSQLREALLNYLDAPDASVDANRILRVFDALPSEDRRASSYRIAISAYLALEMVGPAVQLHGEAASRKLGVHIGTDILLARTVKDNQWDLSLRVVKALIRCASDNGVDISEWHQQPNRAWGKSKDVWGLVATLPYLRGNLESFLLHVRQFQHELSSSEETKHALKLFMFGLTAETAEQVLHKDPADEDSIWDFLIGFFHELRALKLPSSDLYEYTIQRMLKIERYREYTNQRKTFLELYRMYRDESIQNPDPSVRPTQKLFRKIIFQVGRFRSRTGVEDRVADLRKFYPVEKIDYKLLRYLIFFYAESGEVGKVHEYFEELQENYKDRLDLKILISLPFAHARKVDVMGAEKQFRRISQEFDRIPDTACWNVLLLAYTRADDLDGALTCFNNILEAGITPDIHTFGPLLDLCASRGDVEAFEALFSRAEQLKIPIRTDVRARAGYVEALLNMDDLEGAEATAQAMLKSQHAGVLRGALTHTWNLLIQHHALKGDISSSRRLYRQMVENHIPLDSWTYGSLMRALIEVQQTNAAYKILRVTMPRNNVQVFALHYALVISGFIRERQLDHALHAHKRMVDRNVAQTPASRMASLQAIGLSELRKLKRKNLKDPRTRLAAVEETLREILLQDPEAEIAHRQPGHKTILDRRYNSPEVYFAFLIFLYGTRGAYDVCKELFEAATIKKSENVDYEAPLSLLVAIMEAHLRAKEYHEVARCWALARSQAGRLVETFGQAINAKSPGVEFDSLTDPFVKESFDNAQIAPNRRQALTRAARIYIRSLLYQDSAQCIQEAQQTIRGLLTSGFILDNLTWNEFIQTLARRGRILDAFTICEAYLMPSFPGWRQLSPYYIRKNLRGHLWMELRHDDLTKRTMMPRYKTLVILAAAYAQVRRNEAGGMGYNSEMGGWTRDVLEQISPNVVRAIETMPRTGDRLQRRFLGTML